MTGGDLPVDLRLATPRVALDSPVIRLAALARLALELAGGRVTVSAEAGAPTKARDDALSWVAQHDLLLRDLGAAAPDARLRGSGVVVSTDHRTVARGGPAGADPSVFPSVLWAAPASCLLDPPATPPAALTLTSADADRLGRAGVRAVPLLAWPRPLEVRDAPGRVVIALAADADPDLLPAVFEAVAAVLPGRPVLDVVPDEPVVLAGARRAPLHPWQRSRLVRGCDLVLVIGRSAGTDLLVAEATQAGAAALSVAAGEPAPGAAPRALAPLAAALPRGVVLVPVALAGDDAGLGLRPDALAGWLVDVSGAAPAPDRKES